LTAFIFAVLDTPVFDPREVNDTVASELLLSGYRTAASGKSTLAGRSIPPCRARIDTVVLESDELRKGFTPDPHYDEKERAAFYRQLLYVAPF